MTKDIETRLRQLEIDLPAIGAPAGNFLPFIRTGNLLFISGQVPLAADGKWITGRVGTDFSVDEARNIARRTGLNLIAVAKAALPSLDDVERVVKINGYVNACEGFAEQPAVINGCSDLMVEVWGDRGKHARAAVGVASLPGNVPVEIEGIFEVRTPE